MSEKIHHSGNTELRTLPLKENPYAEPSSFARRLFFLTETLENGTITEQGRSGIETFSVIKDGDLFIGKFTKQNGYPTNDKNVEPFSYKAFQTFAVETQDLETTGYAFKHDMTDNPFLNKQQVNGRDLELTSSSYDGTFVGLAIVLGEQMLQRKLMAEISGEIEESEGQKVEALQNWLLLQIEKSSKFAPLITEEKASVSMIILTGAAAGRTTINRDKNEKSLNIEHIIHEGTLKDERTKLQINQEANGTYHVKLITKTTGKNEERKAEESTAKEGLDFLNNVLHLRNIIAASQNPYSA